MTDLTSPAGKDGENSRGGTKRKPKHIILGIDGTWQAAFSDIFQSNVYRMNVALNFQDGTPDRNPQIFIYSAGVGTANRSSRAIAGATGEGIDELVLDAYINLVSNYVPGDKIYVFGFSRGAVAARALTGFISYSGLLKANSSSLVEHAWRHFTRQEPKIDYGALKGRETLPNVQIEFLGVWDTVPGPYKRDKLRQKYRFEHLRLDSCVKCGIHIVSIDETRRAFSPLLWEGRQNGNQFMEQIWMPGVHADIGGGYSAPFISTVSLLMMIDRLAHFCPDLAFDDGYIEEILLPIVENGDVTVHDEWENYIGRFIKVLSRAYRSVAGNNDHNHLQHPLTTFMSEQEIIIRKRRAAYMPSFQIQGVDTLPTVTDFPSTSWYAKKLETILSGRFPKA